MNFCYIDLVNFERGLSSLLWSYDDRKENQMSRYEFKCSFCGKRQQEVKKLIAGPNKEGYDQIFICNECVDLCNEIIAEEKEKETKEEEKHD